MPIQVLMPALSPTMTEGKIAKWLKKEGDAVESGDVLAEIETDKATMEVEAVDEGVFGKILVPEGTEGVAVNAPIALLLEEGEDEAALDDAARQDKAAPSGTGSGQAPKEAPREAPAQGRPEPKVPRMNAEAAATAVTPTPEPAAGPSPGPEGNRVFASPLAKRLAADAGIDLAAVQGSGPHGRIIKRDIEKAKAEPAPRPAAKEAAAPEPAKAAPAPAVPEPGSPYHEVPNSTVRKTIAKRLAASKREIPHYYLTIHCNIDALVGLRADLNSRSPAEGPGAYKLSVNDFVVRAVALALRQYPDANSSWTDEAIR
ncbi:MAG: 2-oxo acid dehydrogenase subunit E2, partial [Allosphingosinicella sp.]